MRSVYLLQIAKQNKYGSVIQNMPIDCRVLKWLFSAGASADSVWESTTRVPSHCQVGTESISSLYIYGSVEIYIHDSRGKSTLYNKTVRKELCM